MLEFHFLAPKSDLVNVGLGVPPVFGEMKPQLLAVIRKQLALCYFTLEW